MLKHKLARLVLSLLLLPITTTANADAEDLESYLQALAEAAAIPGLSFAYLENRKLQLITVGLADTDNQITVTKDTIFEAASLSKPVLAFIVLKLAERGEFSLDQPLYEILQNSRIQNKEWAKLITAKHVLTRQTGLPNWSRGDLELSFKPGSDFNYSGEGYVYLQNVVEKLTGLPLNALAKREVFDPLEMKNSYFTWNEEDQLKLAKGHDRAGNQVTRGIPESNAAASLNTTPEDYLIFVRAWFDNEQLQPASRELAFEPRAKKVQGEPPTTMGWGLGWGVSTLGESKTLWHWGDNGVFRGFVAVAPDTERAFVYFTNSQNGLAISKQLTERFFPDNDDISQWLGYGQSDSPLWQAERKGYEMASQGKYLEAQQLFEEVLTEFPTNQRLKNQVKWFEPLINPPKNALVLDPETLKSITGQYGERRLFLEGDVLKYQRGEGTAFVLTPFFGNVFKVGDLADFRLEIVFDETGKPTKLVGQYDNGYSDASERTSD
ncbi:MAG: serine hydrolase domain-containing protein [Pseudomonadota bacterium]